MAEIEVLKLECTMADPNGRLIPRGVMETLRVVIADEVATFWFKDSRTTKRFALVAIELEKERGANDTAYIERVGKAVTKYPAKTKEQIKEIITNQLKQMGGHVRDDK